MITHRPNPVPVRLLTAGFLLLGGHSLVAQEAQGNPPRPSWYAGISAVLLVPNPDGSLLEPRGRRFGYGLFVGYPLHDRISLNGEFLWLGRDYLRVHETSQLPNAADNRVRALTMAFLANLRLHQPLGPVALEAGAGLGTGSTSLFITSPADGGYTTDGGPGDERGRVVQFLVAVVTPGPLGGGLELGWRRISLEHDFGIYSGGSNQFGADCFYLAFRGGMLPG